MSKTVGRGSTFAINLDEPLSEEDRIYLQDRDPKFRDILQGPVEDELPGDYGDWTVPQLQEEAAARELPTSGRKADLVARLQEYDATNG
jgi:SAP domain